MKQVTQRLRDGHIEVVEVAPPALTAEGVLVDVRASLLSAGTERSQVETGRKSLLAKASSRPDQVRRVIDKAHRDGLRETIQSVRSRLAQPSALGYSSAGVVTAVGSRVTDLSPGDRVACGGGDYAVHAEIDHVPGNLCVPLPAQVSFAEGAFATIGSIAMHGVRQSEASLGERVAVVGLGLVGQLTSRVLSAAGCTVIGVDLSAELVNLAVQGGADRAYTRERLREAELPADARDCDAVLITAATPSDDPIRLAARLCRDRGRVVVIGDVGMAVPRAPYYGKELELRLSRSYGPGRYDRAYEERGLDYPIGYVRWTERRNMRAFVELIAAGRISVADLITERISIDQAPQAYDRLVATKRSPLGILLQYESADEGAMDAPPRSPKRVTPKAEAVGVIGAGSFARRVLIPGLREAGFSLVSVASASGLSARAAAAEFGFARSATPDQVIDDPETGLVVVATHHASHASLASRALRAGKHVFVEKPPCLTEVELEDLRAARRASGQQLVVGFNRRHAAQARQLRDHVRRAHAPVELLYRVSPGRLPPGHWLNDPDDGGGALLGEGCHFVDFACWLMGDLPRRVSCTMRADPGQPLVSARRFAINLDFRDGSLATILYAPSAAPATPKEYIEAHGDGRSGCIDDFRSIALYEGNRRTRPRSLPRDKGHKAQWDALRRRFQERDALAEMDPLDSMAVTLSALRSAQIGCAVSPGDSVTGPLAWTRMPAGEGN